MSLTTPPTTPPKRILEVITFRDLETNTPGTPLSELAKASLSLYSEPSSYDSPPQKKSKISDLSGKEKTKVDAAALAIINKGLDKLPSHLVGRPIRAIHSDEVLHPFHPIEGYFNGFERIWRNENTDLPYYDYIGDKDVPPENRVKYYSEEERNGFEIVFRKDENGVVKMYQNGSVFITKGHYSKHAGKKGTAIFVISLEGKMYAGSHLKKPMRVQHSSFVAGAPVLAAGEITTDEEGRILALTRRSGHYNPDPIQAVQSLLHLKANGIRLEEIDFIDYIEGPDDFEPKPVRYKASAYVEQYYSSIRRRVPSADIFA